MNNTGRVELAIKIVKGMSCFYFDCTYGKDAQRIAEPPFDGGECVYEYFVDRYQFIFE